MTWVVLIIPVATLVIVLALIWAAISEARRMDRWLPHPGTWPTSHMGRG